MQEHWVKNFPLYQTNILRHPITQNFIFHLSLPKTWQRARHQHFPQSYIDRNLNLVSPMFADKPHIKFQSNPADGQSLLHLHPHDFASLPLPFLALSSPCKPGKSCSDRCHKHCHIRVQQWLDHLREGSHRQDICGSTGHILHIDNFAFLSLHMWISPAKFAHSGSLLISRAAGVTGLPGAGARVVRVACEEADIGTDAGFDYRRTLSKWLLNSVCRTGMHWRRILLRQLSEMKRIFELVLYCTTLQRSSGLQINGLEKCRTSLLETRISCQLVRSSK